MAGGGARTQKNKAHKSRFGAKSQRALHKVAKASDGGAAGPARGGAKGKGKGHGAVAKAERLNRNKLLRDKKRADVLAAKRALSGATTPPRLVLLIGLSRQVDVAHLADTFVEASAASGASQSSAPPAATAAAGQGMDLEGGGPGAAGAEGIRGSAQGLGGVRLVALPKIKARFAVVPCPPGDLLRCLELMKVADVVVFASTITPLDPLPPSTPSALSTSSLHTHTTSHSHTHSLRTTTTSKTSSSSSPSAAAYIDDWGRSALSVARAQGLPLQVALATTLSSPAFASSLSSTPFATSSLSSSAPAHEGKRHGEQRKGALAVLGGEFPKGTCQVFTVESAAEMAPVVRHIAEHRPVPPGWRTHRPYLVAHDFDFIPGATDVCAAAVTKTAPCGTLRVVGYVRGHGINVNQLVHITGVGDFQLAQIDQVLDPCGAGEQRKGGGSRGKDRRKGGEKTHEGMEVEEEGEEEGEVEEGEEGEEGGVRVLARSSAELRDPLVVLNTPDPLAGEQTWPTEEEMAAAEAEERKRAESKALGGGGGKEGKGGARRIRVPKGTSSYQAAWLQAGQEESEGEEEDGEEEEEEGDEAMEEGEEREEGKNAGKEEEEEEEEEGSGSDWEDVDEDEGVGGERLGGGSSHDGLMDEDDAEAEAERRARAQWEEMKRLRAQQQEDQEFPDEVDTPDDIPARQRFAKYRGLKSFRSSPWDPKESLPSEYARIFSFDNWKRTQKAAEERAAAVDRGEVPGSVGAGTFVRLHIMNVPCLEAERLKHETANRGLPLVVTGLLQHETRMSVLHFSVRKADSFAAPIKSKQRLLFHVGFRRFYTRPTFSTDDINLDKHKFERFLHPGRFAVASIFAPTLFPPLPLLVFADPSAASNQHAEEGLAATGALRGPDPDRIILKKIVLSGYPVSVMKRKAVVRYMFHQPEDGRWFQPVELFTKYGRRGRIREPVGTKGAIKCVFDGVVQQRDAVCMALYKRVYPKFPVLPTS
ncbi:hypothetical protein CLOP_g3742 [Closterium sp. NIES-67]|nr:hypothetical protein CLOP_g3742 [Closterium sp. NIES-67]